VIGIAPSSIDQKEPHPFEFVIEGDRVGISNVIQQDMQLTDEQWSVVQPLNC